MLTEQKYFDAQVRVRYAETDQMGVVYHANYLVWFEVGRVELLRQLGFNYKTMETEQDVAVVVVEARVRFKSPARYDDLLTIRTRVTHLRRFVLHFGYEVLRASDGVLLASGETIHVITNAKMEKRSLPAECETALRGVIAPHPADD